MNNQPDNNEKLTPEFIILDTVNDIKKICTSMGTSTNQALNDFHATINFLSDCLEFWLPHNQELYDEKMKFEADLIKQKEDNPNFSKKDYNINRERFRFYMKLLNQMGLFLRAEVRGY